MSYRCVQTETDFVCQPDSLDTVTDFTTFQNFLLNTAIPLIMPILRAKQKTYTLQITPNGTIGNNESMVFRNMCDYVPELAADVDRQLPNFCYNFVARSASPELLAKNVKKLNAALTVAAAQQGPRSISMMRPVTATAILPQTQTQPTGITPTPAPSSKTWLYTGIAVAGGLAILGFIYFAAKPRARGQA